jgi:hypothetical protein
MAAPRAHRFTVTTAAGIGSRCAGLSLGTVSALPLRDSTSDHAFTGVAALPTIQPGIGPHLVASSAGIRLPTAYPQADPFTGDEEGTPLALGHNVGKTGSDSRCPWASFSRSPVRRGFPTDAKGADAVLRECTSRLVDALSAG